MSLLIHPPDAPRGVFAEPLAAATVDGLVLLDDTAPDSLVRAAIDADRPILAIGAAALLVTRLLGGTVEPEAAPQFGFIDVEALAAAQADPVTAAAGEGLPLVIWHEDAIELPPGAELLFRCERRRVQGYRFGRASYALRFKPEIDAATLTDLAIARATLKNNIAFKIRLTGEIERHMARHAAFGRALIEAWLQRAKAA